MIKEKIFPNFWQALLIIACWAAMNLIVFTFTTVMIYDHNSSFLYQSIQVILMGLNFVLYTVYLIRRTNIRIWDNFALPDFSTLLIIIIVSVLLTLVIRIPMDRPVSFLKLLMDLKIELLGISIKSQPLVIVNMSMWILFPFLEEILYRGLILEQFLKRYTPTKAILLAGLIFSFAHLNYERFVFIFILGIILGIFYYKTKSIFVSSISHCIFNMAALLEPIYLDLNPKKLIIYTSIFIISILIIVSLLRRPMNTAEINIIKNRE